LDTLFERRIGPSMPSSSPRAETNSTHLRLFVKYQMIAQFAQGFLNLKIKNEDLAYTFSLLFVHIFCSGFLYSVRCAVLFEIYRMYYVMRQLKYCLQNNIFVLAV
jgi:hypothetical protein